MKSVRIIAGYDPTGYAGVLADCRTVNFLGAQPVTDSIETPDAIKIGVIEAPKILLEILSRYSGPVVYDPVIYSSSNQPLFTTSLEEHILTIRSLLSLVDIVTPNIPEATMILNRDISTYDGMIVAADQFLELGAKNVLIKGGHYTDSLFSQDYWTNGVSSFWIANDRHPEKNYRGTGCMMSSALATCLAQGYSIMDAVVIAKMIVHRGIRYSTPINSTTSSLLFAGFPEEQDDLPYLSPVPLTKKPFSFPRAGLGLYPVVDRFHWVETLLSLGVKSIQLRIKDLSGQALEDEIQRSIHLAKRSQALLFVNDYWELALRYDASGVHLGQSDIVDADIDRLHAAGIALGVSTHCYYEVARAHTLNPSYMACGPIFPTTSKIMPFQPQGIDQLKRWRRTLNYPLVAIGGIDHENVTDILDTGVEGISLISAITKSPDPIQSTLHMLQVVNHTPVIARSRSGRGNPAFAIMSNTAKNWIATAASRPPNDNGMFNETDLLRYSHQIQLDSIGIEGQTKLKNARVLCVGAGGLGCPLLLYLASAGVGTLGIIDDDTIELRNLPRQILYPTSKISCSKAETVKNQLLALNPSIEIHAYTERVSHNNSENILKNYDLIADCTDNFVTRYLIHDQCYRFKKPYVFAAVSKFQGQATFFDGQSSPCLRCLFPTPPLIGNCNDTGVFNTAAGLLGLIQATEILKWILYEKSSLLRKLLLVDCLSLSFREIELTQNPDCLICGSAHSSTPAA